MTFPVSPLVWRNGRPGPPKWAPRCPLDAFRGASGSPTLHVCSRHCGTARWTSRWRGKTSNGVTSFKRTAHFQQQFTLRLSAPTVEKQQISENEAFDKRKLTNASSGSALPHFPPEIPAKSAPQVAFWRTNFDAASSFFSNVSPEVGISTGIHKKPSS